MPRYYFHLTDGDQKCPLLTQTDFYGFTKFVGWPSTGSIIRPTA
jgi:hypothetical protein